MRPLKHFTIFSQLLTVYICFSPIAFGKKTDPDGIYIKKYLPQLKKFPAKYIYSPWEAPLSVQKAAGCLIGTDYPRPIVDHNAVSKENMGKMKAAYAAGKEEKERVGAGGGVKRKQETKETNPKKQKKMDSFLQAEK